MLIEQLRNSESLKVTVHFDDISARDAFSVTKEFKKKMKNEGLFIPSPNKFDHAQYTDLFFRVAEQPEGWQRTFITALESAVVEKGYNLADKDGEPTRVYKSDGPD